MKTHNYNPSEFEVNLASAIVACKEEIQQKLKESNLTIVETENLIKRDNPLLVFHLKDKDGDMHELVIKVIQRPDQV